MPILHAPILEQAGFVKSLTQPVINYVARLNGTQYYEFSESGTLTDNFEVSFDVLIDGDPPFMLIAGDNLNGYISFSGGRFQFRDLDGVTRSTQSVFSSSGEELYSIAVSVTEGVLSVLVDGVQEPLNGDASNFTGLYLKYIAARFGWEFELEGYIKNFKLIEGGVTTSEIPLTNKAQGATQLPTVGNVSATMVNYSEDVWEVVEPEPINPDLWDSQRYTDANGADTLNEIISGEVYDLQVLSATESNAFKGMRVFSFQGLEVGESYIFKVESTRSVNLAVYNGSYQLISDSRSTGELEFTASETTRLYVCPIDGELVRVNKSTVRAL